MWLITGTYLYIRSQHSNTAIHCSTATRTYTYMYGSFAHFDIIVSICSNFQSDRDISAMANSHTRELLEGWVHTDGKLPGQRVVFHTGRADSVFSLVREHAVSHWPDYYSIGPPPPPLLAPHSLPSLPLPLTLPQPALACMPAPISDSPPFQIRSQYPLSFFSHPEKCVCFCRGKPVPSSLRWG